MLPLSNQDFLDKEILTTFEACKFLDYSRSYLYKLTHLRRLQHYKPNGKKLYFKKEDLEKYLLRNRIATDTELNELAEKKLSSLR